MVAPFPDNVLSDSLCAWVCEKIFCQKKGAVALGYLLVQKDSVFAASAARPFEQVNTFVRQPRINWLSAEPPALRKHCIHPGYLLLAIRNPFPTLMRNVHWRTDLLSAALLGPAKPQPVCSRVFPFFSPPNGALSRWRRIPVGLWKEESPSTLCLAYFGCWTS